MAPYRKLTQKELKREHDNQWYSGINGNLRHPIKPGLKKKSYSLRIELFHYTNVIAI